MSTTGKYALWHKTHILAIQDDYHNQSMNRDTGTAAKHALWHKQTHILAIQDDYHNQSMTYDICLF
jgi:hypothetical protein